MPVLKLKSSCEIKGGIYRTSAFYRDFYEFVFFKYSILHTFQDTPVRQWSGNVMFGFYLLS